MSFNIPNPKQVGELEEFERFSMELDYVSNFFENLDDLVSMNSRLTPLFLGNKMLNFNSIALESCSKTLKSIKLCCSIGSFADANTLVRKLRDDLIQFVYFLVVINKIVLFDEECVNNTITKDEEALEKWIMNTIHNEEYKSIRKMLELKNYMKVISEYNKVKNVLEEYNLNKMWEDLSRHLNNYVHNNGILYSKRNCMEGYDIQSKEYLNEIRENISYVSSVFVILIFLIESRLFASTDYMDYCELGLTPIENSQYFVASFVQDFIDTKIKVLHPELLEFLKGNNSSGMLID